MSQLLEKTTVRDLLAKKTKDLVQLDGNQSVGEGLRTLRENKITSAPVFEGKKALGFVDILDLLRFGLNVGEKGEMSQDDLMATIHRYTQFHEEKLSKVIGISKRDPFYKIEIDKSLQEAVSILKLGVHRIAVLEQEHFKGVLTQSDVIQFIHDHAQEFQNKLKMNVTQMEITKEVISVNESDKLIQAFEKLFSEGVTGMAVLDKHGKISGNLSASDFKEFDSHSLKGLVEQTVDEFITKNRQKKLQTPHLVFSDHEDTTLSRIINEVSESHFHRIYLVNSDQKPTGIITLTTLISFILNEEDHPSKKQKK